MCGLCDVRIMDIDQFGSTINFCAIKYISNPNRDIGNFVFATMPRKVCGFTQPSVHWIIEAKWL